MSNSSLLGFELEQIFVWKYRKSCATSWKQLRAVTTTCALSFYLCNPHYRTSVASCTMCKHTKTSTSVRLKHSGRFLSHELANTDSAIASAQYVFESRQLITG